MSTLKSDYRYQLPDRLIADKPSVPRDRSRMLVLDRSKQSTSHCSFADFPEILEPGSVLIVNNSKVIPARLPGKRVSGGSVEVLLIEEEQTGLWRCKVKNSARIKPGENLLLCEGEIQATLVEKLDNGECKLQFTDTNDLFLLLEKHAFAPLPPYIHKVRDKENRRSEDLENYQTIFAQEYGAIAAPTAGLHFTSDILGKLGEKQIEILELTLHVGLGTFEPIRVDDILQHKMHEERWIISQQTAEKINLAKKKGRKIVAVGTTSVRTLESAWKEGQLHAGRQVTDLFIYPPFEFKVVDQLLTNFHLPESTLLMLVSALAGKEFVLDAYHQAVESQYRFFSYGDCMFIR